MSNFFFFRKFGIVFENIPKLEKKSRIFNIHRSIKNNKKPLILIIYILLFYYNITIGHGV